jgi:hypothetical protein
MQSTSELGWPRRLCHLLFSEPIKLHTKESKGKLEILVE